jgi:hypothetical protein
MVNGRAEETEAHVLEALREALIAETVQAGAPIGAGPFVILSSNCLRMCWERFGLLSVSGLTIN